MRNVHLAIRYFLTLLVLLGVCSAAETLAADLEFATTPNPVGSGARALGMGGAFIAVADDATAASWNPAGLAQLESPEISAVSAFFSRTEDFHVGQKPEADGKQLIDPTFGLNYMSVAYPFSAADKHMVVSVSYQNLYDFSRNWNFPWPLREGVFDADLRIKRKQTGSLSALGLSYALLATPSFSLGGTLNIWNNNDVVKNKWTSTTHLSGNGSTKPGGFSLDFDYIEKDEYTFDGTSFNFNLGFLWFINHRLTLGGVFKYPLVADLIHTKTVTDRSSSALNNNPQSVSTNETLHMPLTYGLGLGYRFSDALTMSFDVTRSHWENFAIQNAKGEMISPITNKDIGNSNVGTSTQVRLGAEYLIIAEKFLIPIRGGAFYDPAPTTSGVDNYYGLTCGSGFAWGRYAFDIAYQYRFGNNVGDHMLRNQDFKQNMSEHAVYSSLIVHF